MLRILHLVFKMYPGFCSYSGMMRSTDRKTIVIKKTVPYLQFPRGRAHNATRGIRKYQGWSGGRMSEENVWAKALIVVFMGEKNG